jgi:hypothetical protein
MVNDDGLELRVSPNGRKVFAQRGTHKRKPYRITLGAWGAKPDLSLQDARDKAKTALVDREAKAVEAKAAAAAEAEAKAAAFTVADLVTAWEKDASLRLRENTLALHRSRIKNYIVPAWGKRPIEAVSCADCGCLQLPFARRRRGCVTRRGL